MDPIHALDLQVAQAIHRQLLRHRQPAKTSGPQDGPCIIDRMKELLAIDSQVQTVLARQMPQAVGPLKNRWDGVLQGLVDAVRQRAQRGDQNSHEVRSVPDLQADLAQLRRAFEVVEYFSHELVLEVTTPAIILHGADLGRFRIDLNTRSLGRPVGKKTYKIYSLDLRSAASSGIVYHPHVLANYLNTREYTDLMRQARRAGRLADFFQLILKALQSYDPHVAYTKLEDWHRVFCSQCHRELPQGLHTFCESCQEYCCEGCRLTCPDCDKKICQDCQAICQTCSRILCDGCMRTCAMCGAQTCAKCLQTGLCPACAAEWTAIP